MTEKTDIRTILAKNHNQKFFSIFHYFTHDDRSYIFISMWYCAHYQH